LTPPFTLIEWERLRVLNPLSTGRGERGGAPVGFIERSGRDLAIICQPKSGGEEFQVFQWMIPGDDSGVDFSARSYKIES
jgi:hypothetical protein